jgi:hypothetical protein
LNIVGLEDEEAMRKVSRLLSSPSSLPSFSSSLLNSKLLEGKFGEEWVMKKGDVKDWTKKDDLRDDFFNRLCSILQFLQFSKIQ